LRLKVTILFCLTIIGLLTSKDVLAQSSSKNATLKIAIIASDSLKKGQLSYSIYQGETLKSITKIPSSDIFEKEHILTCGTYMVQIYRNDSLYHQYEEIQLECGYKMTYHLHLDKKTSYEILEKSETDMFSTVPSYTTNTTNYEYVVPYFSLGYGTKILEESNYPIQHLFRISSGVFYTLPITRHLGIGYNPELNFELILPKSNSELRANQNYRHERYFYNNLKFGFYFRFSTFDMKKRIKKGMYIDLGANYHLPIFFRHVGLYDNHKDVTRFIHKYNDVSLSFRIGSDKFSLYGQYRLFNFVKDSYPQTPLLSFGILIRLAD